jgi:hypothetical protein
MSYNNSRPVRLYNTKGLFLGQYSSIKEASEETGMNRGSISMCAQGKVSTVWGHFWRYADVKRQGTLVRQYTPGKKLIRQYFSLTEAAEITGVSRKTIARCCQGETDTAKGFVWKYATREN